VRNKAAGNRLSLAESSSLSRFSTSTVSGSEYLVPWLAAEGPLAYTPPTHRQRTVFSNTAGSCPEFSTQQSIYDGTAISGAMTKTPRTFSSTSGGAPARNTELCSHFTANLDFFREVEIKAPIDPSRVSLAQAHGCKMEFILPPE
jgi:hypothetical protein